MYKRRLIVFLSICLLALAVISWLRPTARGGVTTSDAFWSAKTHGGDGAYDIVVAGDSRTLMGVAPSTMREHLPGAAILNFGYLGAGLTPEFIAAAARKIDPSSRTRILVLGVTPLSLISGSLRNKHFKQESNKRSIEREGCLDLEPVRRAFEPFQLFAEAKNAQPADFAPFREGGWMANDGSANPQIALQAYAGLFARSTFDEDNFERLIESLAETSAHGVRVFAFRHPSTRAMEDLETRLSGFREAYVRKRLADVGVTWLSFSSSTGRPLEFASSDGSHLRLKGALALSAELATQIASNKYPHAPAHDGTPSAATAARPRH